MKNKVYTVLMYNKFRSEARVLGIFKKYASATRTLKTRAASRAPGSILTNDGAFSFKAGVFEFEIQVLKVNP